MPRRVSKIIVLLLVGAGVAGTAYWMMEPEAVMVKVSPVEQGRVEDTVTNSRAGTITARQRARISPEIGGRVIAIHFRRGDRVKTGDLVLRLNDAPLRAKLQLVERDHMLAKAKRDQACLEAQRAHREYNRHKSLSAEKYVSQDLLDEMQSASRSAGAACRAGEVAITRAGAAIQEAEAELAKTYVRAPFDGIIAELDTEVGEWITPAPPAVPVPPILDLIDTSSIYVSAPMDEVDSARIHPAQSVRITLDSYPDQHFRGRVTRVAPYVLEVEEQNRTVEIDVEFDDKAFASTLLPGTSTDVEVILSVRENVLRIPTPALLQGNRVFVAEDGSLAEVQVQVGLKNWDYVEIRSGLEAGQPIVTSLERPGLAPGVPIVVEDGR